MRNLKTLVLMTLVAGVAMPALAEDAKKLDRAYEAPLFSNVDCAFAEPLLDSVSPMTHAIPADGYQYFTYVGTGAGLNFHPCGDGYLNDGDFDGFIFDACDGTQLNSGTDSGAGECPSWDFSMNCEYFVFEDGVEYIIAIGEYYGNACTLEFTAETCGAYVDPCDTYSATDLTLPAYVAGSTVGNDNIVGNAAGDAFYTFTATEDCEIIISTCNDADFDTYLRLYDASPCDGGVQLDYNDDNSGAGCTGLTSLLTYAVTTGTEYTVVVEGFGGNEGTFNLTVSCPAPVEATELPMAFELAQNHPNPFNPTTTIDFSLTETAFASLTVYDLSGSEVATLVNGMLDAGSHNVVFDASELASGVYFYTLEAAGSVDTKKMVLLK